MQHAIILGLLVLGPPPATATPDPGAPAVLAQSGENDLLMHPSRETQGAARLGGTEIVNPPHESFGMMQKPTNPSELDIRQGPTGAPTVSGPEAKANAAEVHEQRAAAAQESGQVTREQISADAANAQAAGVQAAISAAATSRAAAETPPADSSSAPSTAPSTAPVTPDQGPEQSGPADAAPPPESAPAAPEPADAPDR
jgi:hypothetical protein